MSRLQNPSNSGFPASDLFPRGVPIGSWRPCFCGAEEINSWRISSHDSDETEILSPADDDGGGGLRGPSPVGPRRLRANGSHDGRDSRLSGFAPDARATRPQPFRVLPGTSGTRALRGRLPSRLRNL